MHAVEEQTLHRWVQFAGSERVDRAERAELGAGQVGHFGGEAQARRGIAWRLTRPSCREKRLGFLEIARQRLVDVRRKAALERRQREVHVLVSVDGQHHHAIDVGKQLVHRLGRPHAHRDRVVAPFPGVLFAKVVFAVGPQACDAAARLPGLVQRLDALRELGQVRAVDPDRAEVEALKAQYRRGGLADSVLKQRLAGRLDELLTPVRARRAALVDRKGDVAERLEVGTLLARARLASVLEEVRDVFQLRRRP